MRVTQNALTRQYNKTLNSNLDKMNKVNKKIISHRKFDRASEDSIGAAKALNVRRSLAKIDMYENNLKSAQSVLSAAEKVMMNASSITQSATEAIIYGSNSTQGDSERKIIAGNLRNLANELLKELNADFAGRSLFGGTYNDAAPFEIKDGELCFNGKAIDDAASLSALPGTKDVYVDIGLDIRIDDDGNVDDQTALKVSINGAEAIGYGKDADDDPKNLVSLILLAAQELESGDTKAAMKYHDKIETSNSNVLNAIADIGNRSEFIDFNLTRIEANRFSLKETQNDIEGADVAEEITNYKTMELAYNATLQMGSALIPPSIFDYIR